jgi:hypothetical protein
MSIAALRHLRRLLAARHPPFLEGPNAASSPSRSAPADGIAEGSSMGELLQIRRTQTWWMVPSAGDEVLT